MNPDAPKILVIDDDPADFELLQIAFAAIGREVLLEGEKDGARALARLQAMSGAPAEQFPDLVVVDLNLPGVHGLEIVAFARSQAGLERLRLIVLSSSDAPRDREGCRRLGEIPYLIKPSGMRAYRELARHLCELAGASR